MRPFALAISASLLCATVASADVRKGGIVEVDGPIAAFPYSIELGTNLSLVDNADGTITLNATGGGGGGSGTVTSITAGTGLSGGTITTSGTISLSTPVSLANGGTNAALTADNGAVAYSDATKLALLASTATANKVLMSGASAAPVWSTPTYPNSAPASGKYPKGDGTNFVASTGSAAGTGSCTNQFVRAENADAAPTCATASLTADVTGTLPVANGGTGATTFTLNGVLYGNTTSAVLVTAQGPTNSVLTASAGAPSFSASPTISQLTITGASDVVDFTITGNATQTSNLVTLNNSASVNQFTLTNAGVGTFNAQVVAGGSAQSTITKGLIVANGAGTASTDIFTVGFHQNFKGTAPTVSACGTTPSLATGSTDNAGVVTIGTGVTTSCTVTFATTFTTAPSCVSSINGTTFDLGVATTATVLTLTSSADMASKVVNYLCMGING